MNRRASFLILASLLLFTASGHAEFRKEPYLIYPGEPDEMWIRWQTTDSGTYTLDWGRTTGYELGSQQSRPDENRYHTVRLEGLSPTSLYQYRISGGAAEFSGSFRAAAQDSARNITFYGLADTQYTSTCKRAFAALAAHIGLPPGSPSFVLLAGDWVQTSGGRDWDFDLLYETGLNSLIAASHPLTSSLPLLGCLGNHDVDRLAFRGIFEQCWSYPTVGSMYWSFDFGPIHIAVVDQYTDLSEDSTQRAWLLQDLAEARSRPWTILLMHDPWASVTSALWTQYREYGVDLILAGHNHRHSYGVFDEIPLLVMTAASKCDNSSCDYIHRMYYEFDVHDPIMTIRAFDLHGALEWEEPITSRDAVAVAEPAPIPEHEDPETEEAQSVSEAPPEDDTDEPRSLDFDRIEWLASINYDENPNTPGNDAWIVEGSDDSGQYSGMAWESPEFTDLSLNELDRFDWSGARAISITLGADPPMDIDVRVSVAGEYCGRTWRNALPDRPLFVTSEPREFLFPASAFSEDPDGRCDGRLAEDALEGTYSIVLFPFPRAGELRVYEVEILESVHGSIADSAIHASPTVVWNGERLPVLDDFSRSDGRSLGGTTWSLDPDARLQPATDGGGLLKLASNESGSTEAELPLAGLPLDDYDGFYVLASGPLGGLLEAEISMTCEEERVESAAAFPLNLNEPIREFRIPFRSGTGPEPTGEVLHLELLSTYGPAEASIYEVGLYVEEAPKTERAEAVVWITPLPSPDESITRIPAESEAIDGLTYLGNPFDRRFPDRSGWENARSVWDMQRWGDRIYLAHGDAYSNAGPTDVWFYDLTGNTFINEATIDEEEIRRFVASDGSLFIPGFDPREPDDPREWASGNLYLLDESVWQKLRTIPWGLHAYDALSTDGLLFVSGDGSEAFVERGEGRMAFVHTSEDGGQTWQLHYPDGVNRIEELFELNGSVYASGAYDSVFLRWTGTSFSAVDVEPFPGLPAFTEAHVAESNAPSLPPDWRGDPAAMIRASHATQWLDGVLYLCSFPRRRQPIETNDFRFVPETLGLYHATGFADGEIERLDFLPSDMMARDLVVRDDVAYILAVGKEIDSVRAAVYRAVSPDCWEVVFAPDRMPGPVFSMEVVDESILFGLGGPSVESGGIYRLDLP